MARVKQKPIRMDEKTDALLAELRQHFPEYSDDTKLLGMMIEQQALQMAIRAKNPAGTPYAGYDPQYLVWRVGEQLLPVLDALLELGWRPALLGHVFGSASSPAGASLPDVPAPPPIDPAATQDVADLGIGFLDDD